MWHTAGVLGQEENIPLPQEIGLLRIDFDRNQVVGTNSPVRVNILNLDDAHRAGRVRFNLATELVANADIGNVLQSLFHHKSAAFAMAQKRLVRVPARPCVDAHDRAVFSP